MSALTRKYSLAQSIRVVWTLAKFELLAQRRETALGLLWTFVWPFVQAGGFLLAFNLIRSKTFAFEDLLITYAGVLVWTGFSSLILGSAQILKNNFDMIRYLSFPFHFVVSADALVKFLFFGLQVVLVVLALWWLKGFSALSLFAVLAFIISCWLLFLSLSWLLSVLGVVIPDVTVALGPILTLLLALSPIFHGPLAGMTGWDYAINIANPLTHLVESFYAALGLAGRPVAMPWGLMTVAVALAFIMRFSVRRLYQELAKIV